MRREHHRHLHAAGATTNSSTSLAAAADSARCSPSTCSSAQQAAAAWAWFEHGGSSCITPSKAQGLVAAKGCTAKLYNAVGAGPSRFKKEVLSRPGKVRPKQAGASADDHHVLLTKPGFAASRRRHSFGYHHDLARRTSALYNQKFRSSCRSTSPGYHFVDGSAVDDDQDVAENEESRLSTISACQNEACSLLDKFEVEAVCKQLHDRFSPSRRSSPCSSADPHECPQSQKSQHRHRHPQEHLKPSHHVKSCGTTTHKPSADNDHPHNINNVVRRLLHLHMKVSSGHSTSAAPAPPFFCSSIATANSIIDHNHHQHWHSPKHSKTKTPTNRTTKWPHDALHNWPGSEKINAGKVSNYSGEVKLNQVSSIAGKVSAEQGDKSRRDDGVLAVAYSKRHRQSHGDHVGDHVHHIHHHHHHYYHH